MLDTHKIHNRGHNQPDFFQSKLCRLVFLYCKIIDILQLALYNEDIKEGAKNENCGMR